MKVFKKRATLQSHIDSFHTRATTLWLQNADYEAQIDIPVEDEASDDSDDEGEDDNIFMVPNLTSRPDDPEQTPIFLPSQFVSGSLPHSDTEVYIKQEIALREGQANDALQGLRLALSAKSVMFRKDLRGQKTKKGKTRAWSGIHGVDRSARHWAQVYKRARLRLILLDAPPATLARYQDLLPEHMSVKTTIIDPAERGTRNMGLAWFWAIDVEGDIDKVDGMRECELNVFHITGTALNFILVYRVHWLKAKAQCDRWAEEKQMLRAEMDFVSLFMANKANEWDKHVDSIPPDSNDAAGLRCYALRQRDMWLRMRHQAVDQFAKTKQCNTSV